MTYCHFLGESKAVQYHVDSRHLRGRPADPLPQGKWPTKFKLVIKLYRTRGLNPRVRPLGRAAASPLWKPHRLCARLKRLGYIELCNNRRDAESAENFPFAQSGDGDWAKTTGDKAMRGRPTGSKRCVRFRFTTLFDRESTNPCQAERVRIESGFG